ncbi:YggT family protein [Candidatus Saccharibacteria bacterium]|nr:YggT family protein [Candidatus Saccharibacteria bacterium]NCS82858.1 YggT family protein [Candidatus Saccharibacteria bacterium]
MNIKYLTNSLLGALFVLVESFLGFRFILKLFGADSSNGFVSWVYEMSGVLLDPFAGIFPARVFENTYVLEFSTLFAMLIYAVAAILIGELISGVSRAKSTKK